jgi:Luciferase-like monooxygenase
MRSSGFKASGGDRVVTAAPDLRLGVHLGQQNLAIERLRELWRRFDERLDWLSCWDHRYEAPPAGGTIDHFEPVSLLGAMAVETSRIRLGCLVFYVGYRTPGVLAKAATTIDHLCGGVSSSGSGPTGTSRSAVRSATPCHHLPPAP